MRLARLHGRPAWLAQTTGRAAPARTPGVHAGEKVNLEPGTCSRRQLYKVKTDASTWSKKDDRGGRIGGYL